MRIFLLITLILFAITVSADVYFEDSFKDGSFDAWVVSNWKQDTGEAGKWELSAGKYNRDPEKDLGLKTTQDAKFYAISREFDEFSNKDKTLILQFRVKHEQKIDCGGGYVKLLPAGSDLENFNGETPYNIMFGPDICGSSTKKVHVIFNYDEENHLIKKNIPCETDEFSHVYTLVVNPDNTYEVRVDNKVKETGNLADDWDMLKPKTIPDPDAKKPEDWVDEPRIPDPEDVKPEGWDDIPAEIPDPEAEKPDDWDDDLDGDWEAPVIPNPEFKGEWSPRMIPNPDYKGAWEHPHIDNPDYVYDENLYAFDSIGAIGIEIWQVKAGSIFSDFLVTDSLALAEQRAKDLLDLQATEKEQEEEVREKEREEAEKAAREEEEEEDLEVDLEDTEDVEETPEENVEEQTEETQEEPKQEEKEHEDHEDL